ncbi:MAG TPA: tetratricopeptide repeat protein [Chloroflexota bacterium]|nr:tetratricopeptide repeat protein [Chloroflexota bacterium]
MNVPARNAPCRCGSGKKYKLCCMPNESRESFPRLIPNAQAIYEEAVAAYGKGDRAGAEAACLRVPAGAPQARHALNLRAMIAHGEGRFADALDLCGQAIAADSLVPEFHNNRGNALQALRRFPEASASFAEAIRLRPSFAEAHNNLANLLLEEGRPIEAIPYYHTALRLRPTYFEAHLNLGNALSTLKRFDEAMPRLREACTLMPASLDALGSLGVAYLALGRYQEAADTYLAALHHNPHVAEYYCSLGDALHALSLSEEAVAAFREAIRLQPDLGRAYNNLGNALNSLGRAAEAAVAYQQALALNPAQAEIHNNLANMYLLTERDEEARVSYRRAVECNPRYLNAAEGHFQTIRLQCAWDQLDDARDRYLAIVQEQLAGTGPMFSSPFNAFTIPLSPLEQRALVERVSEGVAGPSITMRASLPPAPPRAPQQRLRVGYLSADYRSHATAHLLGHLFNRHDRSRFEVFAYSTGVDDGSGYRKRFEAEAERFVDMLGWAPMRAATQIRMDGVDILVDLHGHTVGSSLPTLALHPADLQLHFLGYPGTVGKDFVDYSLVDAVVCPPEHEHYYSEKVYRLPDTYHMNEHESPASHQPRAAYGLPEEGFVFCCFNAAYKLTPPIFQAWTRILERTPGSVLWLYGAKDAVIRNLSAEASRLGCPRERLIFGPPMPKDQHLARLQHADLMLDTPVVNAMTTASDALWAGVPVLSILGESFPDRAGASLLTAIGLPELIMPDLAAYEATAVRLATQPAELVALKARLAANRLSYPLFDTSRFVRNLEAAYEELWARHQVEVGAEPVLSLV